MILYNFYDFAGNNNNSNQDIIDLVMKRILLIVLCYYLKEEIVCTFVLAKIKNYATEKRIIIKHLIRSVSEVFLNNRYADVDVSRFLSVVKSATVSNVTSGMRVLLLSCPSQ